MKVIVIQKGSRHGYAIPRMLQGLDCLEALYTDTCGVKGVGRLIKSVSDHISIPGRAGRLGRRLVDGVPSAKVYVTDTPIFAAIADAALRKARLPGIKSSRDFLSAAAKQWGIGNASHVYSMFGEGLEFLHRAKKRGLTIAVDVFITPLAHRIVAAEQQQYPDWEAPRVHDHERTEQHVSEVIDIADILTCPSSSVIDGLRAYSTFDEGKARLLPYGCPAAVALRENTPTVGRVLFAGTAELRKGIHYLARAATILQSRRRHFDFVVAGSTSEQVRRHPDANALTFLGRLSAEKLVSEYRRADVFVLPSLAEGSATVVYEALAGGIPVVTTPSSGSIVDHGRDGFLVRERDAEQLAMAIEQIVDDRDMRHRMALAARDKIHEYDERSWGIRLRRALATDSPH